MCFFMHTVAWMPSVLHWLPNIFTCLCAESTLTAFSLTGHHRVRGSDRQVLGALRVPLQQDQRPRRIRDGLWRQSMSTFNFHSLHRKLVWSHIIRRQSAIVHTASSASVWLVSLWLTWLACCVPLLCVGWMPFLPLAASIMCCYYV